MFVPDCVNSRCFGGADDENEVVDGWDMVQRPAVWQPDASTAAPLLGPEAAMYLPPPPRCALETLIEAMCLLSNPTASHIQHISCRYILDSNGACICYG